jgi:hypothetical protein
MTARNHRAPLISLFAVFIIPAVMGWFLYHYHTSFSFKTQSHGTLINPPQPHPELLTGDARQRNWQMVYVSAACGNRSVEKILFTLHQVQKSLGKDSDRVSLTWMSPASCSSTQFPGVRHLRCIDSTNNPSSRGCEAISRGDPEAASGLPRPQIAWARNDGHDTLQNHSIYLVDPIGNVFMYYPDATNPMNILKDLKHVLGVSQIG